jgi:hypothetical protein
VPGEDAFGLDPGADSRSAESAACWQRAWSGLRNRSPTHAIFREIDAALTGREVAVRLVEGSDSVVAYDPIAERLELAAEVAELSLLASSSDLAGVETLLALGLAHALLCRSGRSPRSALHGMLDLYRALSADERTGLRHALASPRFDPGGLFGAFLDKIDAAGSLEERDRQVAWLLGKDRVDLPYDRRQAAAILAGTGDADEKRRRLYELLRGYDPELERANRERISAELRERGEWLVFGRMSRAFHNQGLLLADAARLRPAADWPGLAEELAALGTGCGAIRIAYEGLQLLLRSAGDVSLIRLEGALERFEDAALEAQQRALAEVLKPARERIENHADSLAPAAAPPLETGATFQLAERRLRLAERVRQSLLTAESRPAAYVVVSQRPSPTGAHLLAKLNEFEDPYAGKAENLKKLLRLAGDRVYGSPDYGWLEVADHWIEAIPLFIKEEVRVENGREIARTVVDIAAMEESFREEMADAWAINLGRVLESEFLALARETFAASYGEGAEDALRLRLANERADRGEIAALGLLYAEAYRRETGPIQRLVEREEIPPFEAARRILPECDLVRQAHRRRATAISWREAIAAVLAEAGWSGDFEASISRLAPDALMPRRPLPALHVLTTQSAGMTEGYVRTWLEESMALYRLAEDHGLGEAVKARRQWQAARVGALSEQLIRELGLWVEVEELRAGEALSESAAVDRVVSGNKVLQDAVCCLGALLEHVEAAAGQSEAGCVADPPVVAAILESEAERLREAALDQVSARNGEALSQAVAEYSSRHPGLDEREALRRVVAEDDFYRNDLEAYARIAARRLALQRLDAERPELHLAERRRSFLRRYRNLAKTTARKAVIAEHGLSQLASRPLYHLRATGGGKRYHLLYTPSRVDLGARERESVETWAQWVGGADRAAARVGREFYGLINKNVRVFESLAEPEVLKTGENASMASHFAFSNALAMMVAATRRGDFEAMADQMNLRRDRRVHPAGEGYGGYCVPKDGLFLEFVLSLRRTEKLHQIGLPEASHAAAARLAGELLDARSDFGSAVDWEAWAAGRLRKAGLPVESGLFQPGRIAEVLDGLGQPELRDTGRIASSLAARWGLHKMVTGGEQVNRFMPFFKVWLIRQALSAAARRDSRVDPNRAVIVLTAEYKPDTQDGRYSAGMRKLEILAGTGGHLLSPLDAEGQDLALLLDRGYGELERLGRAGRILAWLDIEPTGHSAIDRLRSLFPAARPPAEIRLVAPTGLSTQDVLNYTSDTRLADIAEAVRGELLTAGFGAKEIEANLRTHGPQPERWDHRAGIAPEALSRLRDRLAGRIHALALAVLGPETDYQRAVQSADVLDTGIPHRALLELLAEPGRLCELMLQGNPGSALAIVDGASGARPRAMNRLDVMLWFAAGERHAREPVYLGIGLGSETVESWRADMRRRRRRAEDLLAALRAEDAGRARAVYADIVRDLRDDEAAREELDEADRLARLGRVRERDNLYAEALARIAGGLPLEALEFEGFLALGGLFLLSGARADTIADCRSALLSGIAGLGGQALAAGERWRLLMPVSEQKPVAEFREERGVESSNKATEDRPSVALETRRRLAERLARARGLIERKAAFAAVRESAKMFAESYAAATAALGSGGEPVGESAFGTFIGHARNALSALAEEFSDGELRPALLARIAELCSGRRLDIQTWQAMAGTYEDIGDFGRLAQFLAERAQRGEIDAEARHAGLERIAKGAELFEILLAVDSLGEALADSAGDAVAVWRALAQFFAKTINDHHYEYRPWLYSRGIGYAPLVGEPLYQLAAARHAWLYRYLRGIALRYTELADLPPGEQAALLGSFLDGTSVEAIGAEADGAAERAWRAYGQIRELAFIRNDGFPLPVVFPEFDPELIVDRERVSHVIAAPVGRTHLSRMLREGPTLARELEQAGRPGANLIIGRKIDLSTEPAGTRTTASIRSGHLYLDAAAYRAALARYKPGAVAAEVDPKGIRVAVRFTRPVLAALVYPFHGDPAYTSGALEAAGLPYTVQSLFHTWTTYDKAKYPDIFRDSGVDLPAEIDWLAEWTRRGDEATAKRWIRNGLPDSGYPGLAAFGERHPLLMVKDAAESGGRNMRPFQLQAEGALAAAVDFVYQISLKHNVAIQEVVHGSPETWATEAFMADFVRRQIVEWGQPVERRREPRTPIFGSLRVILSTDNPAEPDPAKKWHASHWITLNSRQLITNVGRGGSLEQWLPEFIRPEFRDTLHQRVAEAGRRAAEALSAYEARAAASYERETGRPVGADLMGVSYGRPRYLMLDFLLAPVFAESAERAVAGWRVVLIEPNIGIGLWDRVALREEAHELRRAEAEERAPDWDRIGVEARIVLRDLSRAGEDYLRKLKEACGGVA